MRTYIQPTTISIGCLESLPLITAGTEPVADHIRLGDTLDCREIVEGGPRSIAHHFTDFMVVTGRVWLKVHTRGDGQDIGALVLRVAPMSQPGMNTGEAAKAAESSVPVTRGDVGSNPTGSLSK